MAASSNANAVSVSALEFSYADRRALDGVSFELPEGRILGVLGPNGGGKTTLFRILATLLPYHGGEVRLFGLDARHDVAAIREKLGVVFQHPSLDPKLTVKENLRFHGSLYGLRGKDLASRIASVLERLRLDSRADDLVEKLSGGLWRRVELAKGILSSARLLILDEPSSGLDPGARRDLWDYLESLRRERGTTVLMTTHIMEEADGCDTVVILDHGRIVTQGAPGVLKESVGGDAVMIRATDLDELARVLREEFECSSRRVGDTLVTNRQDGHTLVNALVTKKPDMIEEIGFRKATLEDVFIRETGHGFDTEY